MTDRRTTTVDGNEAAASVAHRVVCDNPAHALHGYAVVIRK
jgi:hypothetical protein